MENRILIKTFQHILPSKAIKMGSLVLNQSLYFITLIIVAIATDAAEPYKEGEGGSTGQPSVESTGGQRPPEELVPEYVAGRVASLRVQGLGVPILYFSLDHSQSCNGDDEAYFFSHNDPDFEYATKSLVAARLSGRVIKLEGMLGCPKAATSVSASAVHLVESTPDRAPLAQPVSDVAARTPGLHGTVTNLKVQKGWVYFRINRCSGSAPYFRFETNKLPGAFSMLLAAQAAKRPVEVYTSPTGSGGSCPTENGGSVNLGSGGGGIWLL